MIFALSPTFLRKSWESEESDSGSQLGTERLYFLQKSSTTHKLTQFIRSHHLCLRKSSKKALSCHSQNNPHLSFFLCQGLQLSWAWVNGSRFDLKTILWGKPQLGNVCNHVLCLVAASSPSERSRHTERSREMGALARLSSLAPIALKPRDAVQIRQSGCFSFLSEFIQLMHLGKNPYGISESLKDSFLIRKM